MLLSCTGDSYACYMCRIPVTEQVQLYYIIYWTEQWSKCVTTIIQQYIVKYCIMIPSAEHFHYIYCTYHGSRYWSTSKRRRCFCFFIIWYSSSTYILKSNTRSSMYDTMYQYSQSTECGTGTVSIRYCIPTFLCTVSDCNTYFKYYIWERRAHQFCSDIPLSTYSNIRALWISPLERGVH